MSIVYVVGSINQDIVCFAGRHPHIGETVMGTDVTYFPGGKGANQAVAAARAGSSTSMVGAVGDDDAGRHLRSFLADVGIDVSSVAMLSDSPTGTALITVAAGDNTIVVVPGANGLVMPEALAGWSLTSGDVILAQYETPIETTLAAFESAKKHGATTIFNPAPAEIVPDSVLAATDILVVNEHEFGVLSGHRYADGAATVPGFSGVLIVTLGALGAVVHVPENEPGHFSAPIVTAIDSTGAGDCFCGYFASGIADGRSIPESVATAIKAASLSVTRPGAASSIPTSDEVGE